MEPRLPVRESAVAPVIDVAPVIETSARTAEPLPADAVIHSVFAAAIGDADEVDELARAMADKTDEVESARWDY